jgi:hypothetical protein
VGGGRVLSKQRYEAQFSPLLRWKMMFSKRRLHKYIALIQSELFFFYIPQNIFLLQKSKTNLAIRLADKSKAKEEYSTGGTEKLCYAPLEH